MNKLKGYIFFLLIFCAGFFTYFYNYQYPPNFYWDENYHVAHAQKYLNGVFFMENHPPLGKLMIALGEKLIKANTENNQFLGTDHAKNVAAGFSFAGYRFFPAFLAWLSCLVLYGIFLRLFRNPAIAALLSVPYVFDNALIVHFRGAMLDSIQMFFILSSIFFFVCLAKSGNRKWLWVFQSLAFGALFGAVMATKVTGLVLIVLVGALCLRLRADRERLLSFLLSASLGFLVVFSSVWQLHFAIGRRIDPALSNSGYYEVSEKAKELIGNGESGKLQNLPFMFVEALNFTARYNRGVPKLDLCKKDETGSPFFFWPFGARAINYRWERQDDLTRYLYLQVNPATWLCSLIGVFSAAAILYAGLLMPVRRRPANLFFIQAFFAMYLAYMVSIANLSRVMYLYHYFIPMVMGLILFGLVVNQTEHFAGRAVSKSMRKTFLSLSAIIICACFYYFAPLTYYGQLSDKGIAQRAWLGIWDLHCNNCRRTNGMAGINL